MEKIRLNLDALAVESFVVAAGDGEARGTVHARTGDLRCTTDCPTTPYTCTEDTYQATCAGSSCDIYHLCGDTDYFGCQ